MVDASNADFGASFERGDCHDANDTKISSGGVDGAELWLVSGGTLTQIPDYSCAHSVSIPKWLVVLTDRGAN